VCGFGNNLGHFDTVAGCVDRDEGKVRGGDMAKSLLANVFHHGLDADFHRGTKGSIDAGLEDEEIADANRGDEVEVIHGGRDDEGAGVATGSHGADEIHKLHQPPTEEVAEGVAVGGKDNFAAFRLGGADATGTRAIGHSSIVIAVAGG